MNKEEYAMLHKLLALIKYEEYEMLICPNLNKKKENEIRNNISAIERIEKIMILDGGNDEQNFTIRKNN